MEAVALGLSPRVKRCLAASTVATTQRTDWPSANKTRGSLTNTSDSCARPARPGSDTARYGTVRQRHALAGCRHEVKQEVPDEGEKGKEGFQAISAFRWLGAAELHPPTQPE